MLCVVTCHRETNAMNFLRRLSSSAVLAALAGLCGSELSSAGWDLEQGPALRPKAHRALLAQRFILFILVDRKFCKEP